MDIDTRDYLKTELDFFQKNAETQFTHFMGVFYFWTAVVSAPVTAGLLATDLGGSNGFTLGILLLLIAILGMFLAIKMFDIRCSQLKYIVYMNQIRWKLYKDVKVRDDKKKYVQNKIFWKYDHPFPPTGDLRKIALLDFGWEMAKTMSLLHGGFLFFGLWFIILKMKQFHENFVLFLMGAFVISALYAIYGLWRYRRFVNTKIPGPIDT